MRGVNTILIEQNNLFRETLGLILSKKGLMIVASAASFEDIEARISSGDQPGIILIGAKGDDHWLERNICALRSRFSHYQIVVLADRYDADQVHMAFRLSARGYLMNSINCSTLIKSIELVMLGESIFPSAILTRLASENDVPLDVDDHVPLQLQPTAHASRALSGREMQILQCLVRGQSNKMIARSLDIVEATVKVHIKAILRKIHVQNRTQAAIWAVNRLDAAPSIAHIGSPTQTSGGMSPTA